MSSTRSHHKKRKPAIRTVRPPEDKPVIAYRFGFGVVVRIVGHGSVLASANDARELAAVLMREADLAEETPLTGGADKCRQLPDE